jgi:hypothetical protein
MTLAVLSALPQPGLPLFPGFIAQKAETFFVKADRTSTGRAHYAVTSTSTDGAPNTPFMRIDEEHKDTMVFRLVDGREVMRVEKQVHKWSGKSTEYHGCTPDGNKLWHVALHQGLMKTEYRTSPRRLRCRRSIANLQ